VRRYRLCENKAPSFANGPYFCIGNIVALCSNIIRPLRSGKNKYYIGDFFSILGVSIIEKADNAKNKKHNEPKETPSILLIPIHFQ